MDLVLWWDPYSVWTSCYACGHTMMMFRGFFLPLLGDWIWVELGRQFFRCLVRKIVSSCLLASQKMRRARLSLLDSAHRNVFCWGALWTKVPYRRLQFHRHRLPPRARTRFIFYGKVPRNSLSRFPRNREVTFIPMLLLPFRTAASSASPRFCRLLAAIL